MPDVLLGQAYHLRFDPKLWRAQQPYAPLATLYAASYLRSRGHSPALYDAMLAESEREWDDTLARTRPAIAVIYEDNFNYLTKMCLLRMREAAFVMIDHARRRGRPVIVSGSDATDHPDQYLERGADAVILAEGEITLAELVEHIKAGRPIDEVAGIAYRDPAGAIRRTPARRFITDLDRMPFPAWDLVDVERYRAIWRRRHGYYAMNVATTRGCPYHCNWCAKPIYGQRYAVRSPQNVVAEFQWLRRQYKPDQISIVDDVFGLQPGWVDRFAALAGDARMDLPFRCLMRSDQIDARVTAALAAAGCRMVWMGAESGSQKILDAMEKGVRVDQIRDGARLLHAAGISVGLFLQFGYPGEAWDDIEATLNLSRELDPEDIGVSVSYPLPGTKFYARVRAELGQKQNWVDSDDLAMMYRAAYTPGFYRLLHHVVHYDLRLRRHGRALAQAVARPWTFRLRHLRHAAAWIVYRAALPLAAWRLGALRRHADRPSHPSRLLPMLSPAAAATPAAQAEWTTPSPTAASEAGASS